MRVVLVGSRAERLRLRADANGSLEIVGEAPTIAGVDPALRADAILVAPSAGETALLDDDRPGPEALTDREMQVLALLTEGLSNRNIAAHLGISDQTVKFHVASICGKLGAHNRTEAVRLALRRGLIAL